MFPLILLGALGLLFLGGALFQVGRGADYKARAQTGADAAAVAAARALGLELVGAVQELLLLSAPPAAPPDGSPPPDPSGLPLPDLGTLLGTQDAPLRSEAVRWAGRNDNDVEAFAVDRATFSVTVGTRTKGAVSGFGGGQRGHARARAQLQMEGLCLPAAAATGVIPACGEGQLPDLGSLFLTVRLVSDS